MSGQNQVTLLNFEKNDGENATLIELRNVSLKAKGTCLDKLKNNSETGTAEDKVRRCTKCKFFVSVEYVRTYWSSLSCISS